MSIDDAIRYMDAVASDKLMFTPIREAADMAATFMRNHENDEALTPCDVCRYSPPSSCDGKPCTMCPAEGKS